MWRSPAGVKTTSGKEAELLREVIGWLYDHTDDAARYEDPEIAHETGVRPFDALQPSQRLAMLAEVGEALLDPDVAPPELTAVSEATVAALVESLRFGVFLDIESQEFGDPSPYDWRPLVLAWAADVGIYPAFLPAVDSTDPEEWMPLIDTLADGLLWDEDYEMEDLFVDLSPEHSKALRSDLNIPDGYFSQVAPDPTGDELKEVRARLNALTGCTHLLD
jgi:hypothetical protein